MSKTDIRKTNYTPIFDTLVDKYGIYVAAVFGRVWRYCQMERGYCHAEQERIADELNVSRKTVNGALKILVRDGYLFDATPNTNGRTRIYKDTGKVGTKTEPVTGPVTGPVTEPVTGPVTESYTKIDKKDKKEKKDNTTTRGSAVSIFLENAGQEQLEAFELVRKFASEEKAVQVASREYPLEAARDFLEWCADRGSKAAERAYRGILAKEAIAELDKKIEKLQQMFLLAAKEAGCTDPVTYDMFDYWKNSAIEDESVLDKLVFYAPSIRDSMIEFFRSDDSKIIPVNLSSGIYV